MEMEQEILEIPKLTPEQIETINRKAKEQDDQNRRNILLHTWSNQEPLFKAKKSESE